MESQMSIVAHDGTWTESGALLEKDTSGHWSDIKTVVVVNSVCCFQCVRVGGSELLNKGREKNCLWSGAGAVGKPLCLLRALKACS